MGSAKRLLHMFFGGREFVVMGVMIGLAVIMSFLSPYFLDSNNIFNILRGMTTIGVMAIGMTMIIITGGIDLSVGSMLAASCLLTARLLAGGMNAVLAVILGLAFGAFLGFVNGVIITKLRINPFITTLGMLSVARGLAYLFASGIKGRVVSNIPMDNEYVNFIGGGYFGMIPFAVILLIVLVILSTLFLRYTVTGRYIYAVGSNERSARLSGIRVDRVRIFVYTVTGACCALAGIMIGGVLSTASTNSGTGNELDVIAACVIGGASLSGGEGTIIGAVFGAIIMAIVRNAFVLLHVPAHFQTIAIGVVIVLAVGLDSMVHKNRS
jgi:Ribose/xylose/arabinose/galactoside ABC-type transport systems, permease components